MGIIILHAHKNTQNKENFHKQQHRLPYFVKAKTKTNSMFGDKTKHSRIDKKKFTS